MIAACGDWRVVVHACPTDQAFDSFQEKKEASVTQDRGRTWCVHAMLLILLVLSTDNIGTNHYDRYNNFVIAMLNYPELTSPIFYIYICTLAYICCYMLHCNQYRRWKKKSVQTHTRKLAAIKCRRALSVLLSLAIR